MNCQVCGDSSSWRYWHWWLETDVICNRCRLWATGLLMARGVRAVIKALR
jgi:hypothetical protein